MVIKEEKLHGYNLLIIDNNKFRVGIVPQLGGKIISYTDGEIEFMHCFDDFAYIDTAIDKVDNVEEYRKKLRYIPPGGDKIWLAPQDKWGWPPYIDLEIGEYSINKIMDKEELTIILESGICRETNIKIVRKIVIRKNCKTLKIEESIENCGNEPREYGIWGVTQIDKKGEVIFPCGTKQNIKPLIEREWEKCVKTIKVDKEYYCKARCKNKSEYKIGTSFSGGWVLTLKENEYNKKGYLKRSQIYNEGTVFGHGCAVEVYNSPKFSYFEVELHGPLVKLNKGEKTTFCQEWEIITWAKEDKIEKIVKEIRDNN